jgi:hypothetical protein
VTGSQGPDLSNTGADAIATGSAAASGAAGAAATSGGLAQVFYGPVYFTPKRYDDVLGRADRADNKWPGPNRLGQAPATVESKVLSQRTLPSSSDVVVARHDLKRLGSAHDALQESLSGYIAAGKLQRPSQELRREVAEASLRRTRTVSPDRWERIQGHLEEIHEHLLEDDLRRLAKRKEFSEALSALDAAVSAAHENAEPMTRQQNPDAVQQVLTVVGNKAQDIWDQVTLILAKCRNRSTESLQDISDCLDSIFTRSEGESAPRHANLYSSGDPLQKAAGTTAAQAMGSSERLSASRPAKYQPRVEETHGIG